jgi:hypothetical protein
MSIFNISIESTIVTKGLIMHEEVKIVVSLSFLAICEYVQIFIKYLIILIYN